jgi:hypothetical protein
MRNGKTTASLSLDLDNQWSYMKASGIAGWEAYPGYLDRLVPRILETLARHGLRITFFIVGKDAAKAENGPVLQEIARGHEVANHSFRHEPSISQLAQSEIEAELNQADDAIEAATGVRPRGFRGPSFALSTALLETLKRLGYAYDASTFPTFIGPLARWYHFRSAALSPEQIAERALVFGTLSDGLRPLKPYRWQLSGGDLLELPVTTIPGIRSPFHLTYLSFLAQVSPKAGRIYFNGALKACKIAGVSPSLLLHPLDFVGGDELPVLKAFPGMGLSTAAKLDFLDEVLGAYAASFDVVPMGVHATRAASETRLPLRRPGFATDSVQ